MQYFVSVVKRKGSDVEPSCYISLREKKTRCFRRVRRKILGSFGCIPMPLAFFFFFCCCCFFFEKKSSKHRKVAKRCLLTEQSTIGHGDEFAREALMIAQKRNAFHQFQSVDDVAKDTSEEGHVSK